MPIYTGGLRARLIKDSIYEMLYESLDALNWFDSDPSHQDLSFPREPVPIDTQVPLNTISLGDDITTTEALEVGSNLGEFSWQFYVDFYAENDTLALHLIRDVKDILEGRLPSIGRGTDMVDVYDYTMATPARIFNVEIDDVRIDKANNTAAAWLRHWYSCQFLAIDSYNDEDG